MAQQQTKAVATTAEQAIIKAKNTIANSVMHKIEEATKSGAISLPRNYNAGNQINLAMLVLMEQTTKDGTPVLQIATPASVANALFRMVILGMSLEKKQCDFILYKDKLQFQMEYHGRIALAKRLGGAGQPVAQCIYKGDEFEYIIDTKTGNKVITKHVQKLENIDNGEIVGAWCIVPYANEPDRQPFIEIMTMAEIRQSWLQGPTNGNSPAHRNFTQEMCKKTVMGRACKLFISTSDDAGMYDFMSDPDNDIREAEPATAGTDANSMQVAFEQLGTAAPIELPGGADVDEQPATEQPTAEPEPVKKPAAAPDGGDDEEGGIFQLQ